MPAAIAHSATLYIDLKYYYGHKIHSLSHPFLLLCLCLCVSVSICVCVCVCVSLSLSSFRLAASLIEFHTYLSILVSGSFVCPCESCCMYTHKCNFRPRLASHCKVSFQMHPESTLHLLACDWCCCCYSNLQLKVLHCFNLFLALVVVVVVHTFFIIIYTDLTDSPWQGKRLWHWPSVLLFAYLLFSTLQTQLLPLRETGEDWRCCNMQNVTNEYANHEWVTSNTHLHLTCVTKGKYYNILTLHSVSIKLGSVSLRALLFFCDLSKWARMLNTDTPGIHLIVFYCLSMFSSSSLLWIFALLLTNTQRRGERVSSKGPRGAENGKIDRRRGCTCTGKSLVSKLFSFSFSPCTCLWHGHGDSFHITSCMFLLFFSLARMEQ